MSETRTNARPNNRRRRYFVDKTVQGALLLQATKHWLWASLTFVGILFVYRILPAWFQNADDGSGNLWFHISPYLLACAILFPIVVMQAIRFSNRFVGPMVQVRRALAQLASGEIPNKIKFRQGDFWSDLADDINQIGDRMQGGQSAQELRAAANDSTPPPAEADETSPEDAELQAV